MSKELFYLIDQIAREKGVSKDVLLEALSTALLSAAKKKLDGRENLKVEVDEVQVANVKGKKKRFGGRLGRRRNWKKAYICLKPGQEINFAAGETK